MSGHPTRISDELVDVAGDIEKIQGLTEYLNEIANLYKLILEDEKAAADHLNSVLTTAIRLVQEGSLYSRWVSVHILQTCVALGIDVKMVALLCQSLEDAMIAMDEADFTNDNHSFYTREIIDMIENLGPNLGK